MSKLISRIFITAVLIVSFQSFAQEDNDNKSNIQTYTPSKLLDKNQWDIKFFNNLYTETKDLFGPDGTKRTKPRENYLTSTVEVFTGISDNNRVNLGVIVEFRSNNIGGRNALSVFSFDERAAITTIAPSLKWQPFENIGNFSVQSSIHIPLVKNETKNDVFLDEAAWNIQNRFFYDHTFSNGKWQLFTELNTQYFFGKEDVSTTDNLGRRTTIEGSFASNTFILNPGLFLSYFPSDKSTVLGFVQHTNRFGDFTQDFTTVGFGGKYQLTDVLNLEALYSKFVRGNATGLGESFNIGLRALF
ncbi:hypothetical protein [Polaribacter aestuariivivens]|uniref:hypothetical protein n=1 Tax=Polaribacter aestuariivivens TaxID=2304626 RepID=UPI003F494448